MSITDLIVELIEKGQRIGITGIGTLDSEERPAHHDAATRTYYPASRTVAFSPEVEADDAIIATIAERECVSPDVAKQMWHNYVDALTDKMKRSGSHTFGRLGELTYSDAAGYGFKVAPGLVLDVDNRGELPIENIKTYSHEGEADPFAAFDEVAAQQEAEAKRLAAEKAEAERLAAEKAEAERLAAEKAEAERLAAEKAEADRIAAEKAEAERLAAEKAEAERLAALEAQKAEQEAARKAEAEHKAAEQAKIAAEEAAEKERLKEEEKRLASLEAPVVKPTAPVEANKEKKRKSRWWLWLLLLLLLLLAGGAYYYFTHMRTVEPTAQPQTTEHLEGVGATNSLTYNCDMIEYSQRDMRRHSELVNQFMAVYLDQYLAERGYRSARVPMMDRVRQYSADRIGELLGSRFAVQRLIPYEDYIYHYCEPFLKEANAKRARVTVQKELMSNPMLDDMLQRVISELGLQPDAGAPRTAAAVQEVKQSEREALAKKKVEEPINVYVEKGSKQGFDLIAGFYLDKATAARMSGRLHSLGCDAYIIEFNDLYYVSMGSANSQTAADALLKHVKSWYDGDVVIKKW